MADLRELTTDAKRLYEALDYLLEKQDNANTDDIDFKEIWFSAKARPFHNHLASTLEDFEARRHLLVLSSLIANGEIIEIPPLEFLKRKNTIDNIGSAAALTGTITINVSATANEYDIFQKYATIYPGVKIQYGEKVNLTEAYSIEFYTAEEYSIGLTPYASYLTNGNKTWL